MRSGDTPVPIPNTMVKTWAADGTMLETAWESRWLPGSLKIFWLILREPSRCGNTEVEDVPWKLHTEKFFFKRKATSDFYDKKEFLYNCSANLDYGCNSILHLDPSERHITKNITKAASKQAYAVLFRFCCMAEQLSKILPIASRKTKHEF